MRSALAFAKINLALVVSARRDGKHDLATVLQLIDLHDTIAIFSIERGGRPELIDEEWTRGDYPRSFNIDPSGRYMYVCNQRSDAITTFRVLGNGSRLSFANRYTPVGSPARIIFL